MFCEYPARYVTRESGKMVRLVSVMRRTVLNNTGDCSTCGHANERAGAWGGPGGHSREIVDLALRKVQLGEAFRIAAEPAADGHEGIDERIFLAWKRVQFEGLAKHTRPGLQ